jgi:hypothetical protein
MRKGPYRPTESKYKGRAHEMYVSYDLQQKTRDGFELYQTEVDSSRGRPS